MALLVFSPAQPTHTAAVIEEVVLPVVIEEEEHEKITEPSKPEACNCVTFVRNRVQGLPKMAAIFPISEPQVGGVAIEFFKGIKHISVITEVESGGVWVEESNYIHCEVGTRYIPYSKSSLVGFWSN